MKSLASLKELSLGMIALTKGNNLITRIMNLNDLTQLEMLGLELNQIEVMENLDYLVNLKLLMLGGNLIKRIENLASLSRL
jgi:Leucine-rich repeat (LRR) protein